MTLLDVVMTPTTETLCVSLSSKPGIFGTTVHNAGYKALDINYKYVACASSDIVVDLALVSLYGVRGASISMPFKVHAMKAVNQVMPCAIKAGAINTVVNEHGWLRGYNTDIHGFSKMLKASGLSSETDKVIKVIGAGGVCRAILAALEQFANVVVYARNVEAATKLATLFNRECKPLSDINCERGVVVNATPLGMNDEMIDFLDLSKVDVYLDTVVKVTPMVKAAKSRGIVSIDGTVMALYQAAKQFELYTGKTAPIKQMMDALHESQKH